MYAYQLLCSLVSIVGTLGQRPAIDPCRDYTTIPEVNRRGAHYAPSGEEPHINDNYLEEGWYGKPGYDMLLEAPVAFVACGSNTPIYLKGTLPVNTGDIEDGTGCVIGWAGNCMVELPVQIKRCSDTLNVYYLQGSSVPFSSYCFGRNSAAGTLAPAPDFRPTSVKVEVDLAWTDPIITPRVTLRAPYLVFICSFNPVPENLYYQINWFVNSQFILSKGPFRKENLTQLTLTETDLHDKGIRKLGFNVKCGIRALADEDGLAGDMSSSVGFYAGIKVQTPTIVMQRSKEINVTLVATVPYACAHVIGMPGRVDSCPGNIETYYTRGTSCRSAFGVVDSQGRRRRSAQRCGVALKQIKLADVNANEKKNWTQHYIWTIAQMDDGVYQLPETHFRVKLRVSEGTQHSIWSGHQLDDINVHVQDHTKVWRKKTCKAYCDPHMTTFDGTPYEMQKPGVFVLYRHKQLPIEVQLRSERCVSGVPNAHCPCGVYVRGGADIYILSTCTDNPFIDFLHCGEGSIQVYRQGDRSYKIYLPTGASVSVNLGYRWQINVAIDAAPRDANNVEGLCGDLTGKRADDFIINGRDYGAITRCGRFQCRNQFIDFYNLNGQNAGRRFFPPTAQNRGLLSNLQTLKPTEILCVCPLNVDRGVAKSACSSKVYVKCQRNRQKLQTCAVKSSRKKREIEDRLQELQIHLSKFSNALKRRKRSVSLQTITEDQARTICQAKFANAGSFQYCHANVPGIENTQEVENCIFDLNMTGLTDWAEAALDSVTHECLHEAEKNNTLQNSTDGGQSIAEVIETITCPNECSGKGNCVDGVCECYGDFAGSDCSFELKKAPVIHTDVGNDICDKSKGPCEYINIFGEDFIDSDNLTCRIKEYQLDLNGNILNEQGSTYLLGDARSPFEVRCPLSGFRVRRSTDVVFVQKYVISIANDGTLFGVEREVFVADSTCQVQSNITNVFTLKENYCYIDGKCIPEGQTLEGSNEQTCLPQNNTFHWTFVEATGPVETEPCMIYKPVSDITKRSESAQPGAEQINDDDLEEGWYGVDGYDMLMKAPQNQTACGSSMGPIWLQGTLPVVTGNVSTGSGCVVGWVEGCVLDIPVDVKKCSETLNIYYLQPTNMPFTAYCFEPRKSEQELSTLITTQTETVTPLSTVSSSQVQTTSTERSTASSSATSVETTTVLLSTSPQISPSSNRSTQAQTSSTSSSSTPVLSSSTPVHSSSASSSSTPVLSSSTPVHSSSASSSPTPVQSSSTTGSSTEYSTSTTTGSSTEYSTSTRSTTKRWSRTVPTSATRLSTRWSSVQIQSSTERTHSIASSSYSSTILSSTSRDSGSGSSQQQDSGWIIGLVIGLAVLGLIVVIAAVVIYKKMNPTSYNISVEHPEYDTSKIIEKPEKEDKL